MITSTNRFNLISCLLALGYTQYTPVAKTWSDAFVFSANKHVLCILLRKHGVDFRIYENYKRGITIDDQNQMSMYGGMLYRNHYNKAEKLIHHKAKIVARNFVKGCVRKEIRHEDGHSYLLNPEQ